MKIGLYIPCYNASGYIDAVLKSVFEQTIAPDEVLVIDDGSEDGLLDIAEKYPVKYISHSKNKGLAASRNTALNNMHSDFVASLDADCAPAKDWLEKLFLFLKSSDAVGVGGRVAEPEDKTIYDK